MLGPFATASRHYITIHQVSLLSHASYSYSAGGVRCPRRRRRQRQRQRVTEGTATAPWNAPNHIISGTTTKTSKSLTDVQPNSKHQWSIHTYSAATLRGTPVSQCCYLPYVIVKAGFQPEATHATQEAPRPCVKFNATDASVYTCKVNK